VAFSTLVAVLSAPPRILSAVTSSIKDQQLGIIETNLIRKGIMRSGKLDEQQQDILGAVEISGRLDDSELRLLMFACSLWQQQVGERYAAGLKQLKRQVKLLDDREQTRAVVAARISSDPYVSELDLDKVLRGLTSDLPARAVDLSALNHQDLGLIQFQTKDAIGHMRGRRATGADIRRLSGSILKLLTTVVTIEGFDAWTSERKTGMVDHMPLLITYSRPEDMSLVDVHHSVRLAPWLARSLAAGHHTSYHLPTSRKLRGVALSLWLWLEAQRSLRDKRTSNSFTWKLYEPTYVSLGISAQRATDRRKQLVKACDAILEADRRYRELKVIAPSSRRDPALLRAVRINETEARSLPKRSETLIPLPVAA